MNNIRNEFKNSKKLSNDPFKDAETTKLISDSFYPTDGLLSGFLHEIGLNPFGFILISDFQVFFLTRQLNYLYKILKYYFLIRSKCGKMFMNKCL